MAGHRPNGGHSQVTEFYKSPPIPKMYRDTKYHYERKSKLIFGITCPTVRVVCILHQWTNAQEFQRFHCTFYIFIALKEKAFDTNIL